MARLTNETLHNEINLVKQDVVHIKETQSKMQADLSMIKERLLNPDKGVAARVNRNTAMRKVLVRAMWVIYSITLGALIKLFTE